MPVRPSVSESAAATTATIAATKKARWKPSASAVTGSAPAASESLVKPTATVASTATPIAPPTSWDVLTRPDASPLSRSVKPVKAAT